MTSKLSVVFGLFLAIGIFAPVGMAQTTGFTYQGSLNSSGVVANGNHDFEFALFDALSGGAQLGATITQSSVTVTNGIFAVSLDFGSQFPGAGRFLDIRVRPTGGGAFTTLLPRQQVSSTPYAVRSLSAASADAVSVGGVPGGSGNYVQNTTSPQAASNFNISGDGTAGGTLSGNIVTATTQYNIGGSRVLSVAGNLNLFAGVGAGGANTTGGANSFFGFGAGQANTAGGNNSFFGRLAGTSNTSGSVNSFFGTFAGQANTLGRFNSFFGNGAGDANTLGEDNSFFGNQAGKTNINGDNNTIIGDRADVGLDFLNFATAIGAGSIVSASNTVVLGRAADTVQVPGNLNVTGTLTGSINGAGITNLNASNITTGTLNPVRLGVVPIANGGTNSATQNFVDLTTPQTIAGNKTFSNTLSGNIVNATTQYNIGGSRVLSIAGTNNVFAGVGAGSVNVGNFNSFFGNGAGSSNTSGFLNSFFGGDAGLSNNTGSANAFFGHIAGDSNTLGGQNSFFGQNSGSANTIGNFNSFFGGSAGEASTTGNSNSFFGVRAGVSNSTGSNNTIIGTDANVGPNNLTFATAIGASAVVSASNTVVLGRAADTVQVPGNLNVAGTVNAATQYNIGTNRVLSIAGTNNVFAGVGAGQANPTGTENSFFGKQAGFSNTTGHDNSFFGNSVGDSTTSGDANSFFGSEAGNSNTAGLSNSFFGFFAGSANTTGNNNTAIGGSANFGSGALSNATAIGAGAVVSTSNTILLGRSNGSDTVLIPGTLNVDSDVGIGTTAPAARLHVVGSSSSASTPIAIIQSSGDQIPIFFRSGATEVARIRANSVGNLFFATTGGTDKNMFFRAGDDVTTDMFIEAATGRVGIGTTAPDMPLTVNGNASKVGGGSWAVFSDERLKKINGRFTPGLAAVMRLQPVLYQYKTDNAMGIKSEGEHVGFSAQAIEQVIPEAVTKNDQGYRLVNNDPIMWTMLNAIKEQQGEIEGQQKQIDEQKEIIKKQRSDFEALKAVVCLQNPAVAICKSN